MVFIVTVHIEWILKFKVSSFAFVAAAMCNESVYNCCFAISMESLVIEYSSFFYRNNCVAALYFAGLTYLWIFVLCKVYALLKAFTV